MSFSIVVQRLNTNNVSNTCNGGEKGRDALMEVGRNEDEGKREV